MKEVLGISSRLRFLVILRQQDLSFTYHCFFLCPSLAIDIHNYVHKQLTTETCTTLCIKIMNLSWNPIVVTDLSTVFVNKKKNISVSDIITYASTLQVKQSL